MAQKKVDDDTLAAAVAEHGQNEAARRLGVSKQAVSKRLNTPGRRDSAEELRVQRARKCRADADRAELMLSRARGELIPKENVNAAILAHAARFNRSLRTMRNAGPDGADYAKILLECFDGFGEELDAILSGKISAAVYVK
ncbi:MAG: hypothetical protein H3C30_04125 [Candidatus Hydrogenedentes bacterium]|nr:hypothetical protein [Candidatus Hydrogenedentota bacterium]